MKRFFGCAWAVALVVLSACGEKEANPVLTIEGGQVKGVEMGEYISYKGIPFAAAPVGDLRWKEPQPVVAWEGVKIADTFGDDPMQPALFGDMNMKGPKKSEDCLYLNIWAPKFAKDAPVLIYFNGGGLMCGSGTEPRYAGDSLACHGIISITASYREGMFGFLAHPELTAESENHTSGNYGFLDQVAAIRWVKNNIAAFGGNPNKITIVGESAGSFSVSVLMGSPLSRDLIAGAIASSGAELNPAGAMSLEAAEAEGAALVARTGMNIAQLRQLSADSIQALLPPTGMPNARIDGYLLDKSLDEIFIAGEQAQVPLMGGWNSMEAHPMQAFAPGMAPTFDNFKLAMQTRFGEKTDEVLNAFGIKTDADVMGWGAIELCGALFTGFPTWKWFDYQSKTANPCYRYKFNRPRPQMVAAMSGKVAGLAGGVKDADDEDAVATPSAPQNAIMGAVHSADIEYAMGNLKTNLVYDWQPEDFQVEQTFMHIYINFIKTGNPNGEGVPAWTAMNGQEVAPVMQIDVESGEKADANLENAYKLLDAIFNK